MNFQGCKIHVCVQCAMKFGLVTISRVRPVTSSASAAQHISYLARYHPTLSRWWGDGRLTLSNGTGIRSKFSLHSTWSFSNRWLTFTRHARTGRVLFHRLKFDWVCLVSSRPPTRLWLSPIGFIYRLRSLDTNPGRFERFGFGSYLDLSESLSKLQPNPTLEQTA